jgi:hypothetical protein
MHSFDRLRKRQTVCIYYDVGNPNKQDAEGAAMLELQEGLSWFNLPID